MPGSTSNLDLYLPDAGQSGVAAQLNTNWSVLDNRFDEATGHTHDGTEGEGPPIAVTSIAAIGVPDATKFLRGDGQWAAGAGGGAGVTDHGELTGLSDDDHAQYYNQARGDARYLQRASNLSDVTNATTARTNLGAAPTVHQHAAADITSGTMDTARLGSGTASTSTFLRGDKTWATPAGGSGSTTLDDLTDVLITTPSDNQVLTYDSTSSSWRNETPAAPPASLTTEQVQDIVAAEIVAGSNITTTYDDTAGTVTIAATGGGSAVDPLATVDLIDEFISGGSATGAVGALGFATTGGSASGQVALAGHPGVLSRSTGATAGTNTVTILASGAAASFMDRALHSSETFDYTWIVAPEEGDANTHLRIGLFSATTGSPAPSTFIGFEKLYADTTWFYIYRTAAAQPTRVSSGVTIAANTWARLRARRLTATTVGFSVNGGTETVLTAANGSNAPVSFGTQIENQIASTRSLLHDLCRLRITGLTR